MGHPSTAVAVHLHNMASRLPFFCRQIAGVRTLIKHVNKSGIYRTSLVASTQKRYGSGGLSEDLLREAESKQSWFDWFFPSEPEKVVSEQEKQDRAELLERIQACYYAKPPTEPGIEHFEEAFNLLMKYDDWRSVEALWRLSEAQQLEFDGDLLDKIEDFLLEWRQRRWFER